jgi:succinoglycan biosynthesis protein ExoA
VGPFISVIVPVRNEAAFIRATLEQILTQRYPSDRFEVLVADGESTDATRAIVTGLTRDHANLRLLENARRWSSAGRNAAVRAARGDLVVLVDGHCDLDNPNYLREVAAAFARSGADCVGRPQPLDVGSASPLQRAIAAARSSRLGHHPASFIYSDREQFVPPESVAVAYRRGVFDAVGLFDERFDACEDVEFNHRVAAAGLTCFFTPRVRVRYFPRSSVAGLFRQMVRYGRGRVRLLRKHPETFTPAGFLPGAFLLGVLTGPLAALLWPGLWWVYGGVLGLYSLTVLLFSAAISVRQRSARLFPLLAAVFATVHLGSGWGILREVFTFRGRGT